MVAISFRLGSYNSHERVYCSRVKAELKGASFYPVFACAAADNEVSITTIGRGVLLTAKLRVMRAAIARTWHAAPKLKRIGWNGAWEEVVVIVVCLLCRLWGRGRW